MLRQVLLALHYITWLYVIEGSLEVKLPTIRTDGKAEVGRVREEKGRRKKIREEKRRQKIQARKNIPVWCAPPPGAKVFHQKTG